MKNYTKILISCFCLFLFALACTKEVGLITEVEFELSEQHTAEGYVNQGLPSTFTIVPEEVLENYEYTITYEVLDGEGHFEDMEGNRLESGKGWPVSEGLSAPLVYMGSKTGGHRVKITGANNFGISQDIEVTYELSDVPVVWEASSELSELELEKPVDVSLVFERLDTDLEVGYQAVYGFGSGAGSLGPSEENGYAPKGEYGPIVPGTYPLVFTPSEIGPQQLVFTLRDSNGQEIEASVDFNVVDFIEVISLTLSSQDTIKMKLGDEIPPAFTFDPPNASDQEVTVVSSDPDVVFIDENNVCIAVGLGMAEVTVTSVSNPDASDTVTVEVIPPDRVPVTGISVSQADPGATGAQRQLMATVLPDNATDPAVNWSSGDNTIATVDGNGILTGLSAGTVTITATSVSDPEVSGSILVEITGVSLQSANDIEAFALNGQIETATIDTQAHTVSVTVPEGTPLNVAPVLLIVSEGANVAPALLQARDFTSPVEYTVTSGNGTEQVWTVTAKVLVMPVAGDTDITAFGLPGQNSSDIDTENHTISVNVPDGTNLNVAPQVLEISPGATVAPAIDQVRDFSGAVTYTVSPETGTPQVWTVNVTVSQPTGSDLNAITGFALPVQNSVTINDVDHTITVNVPNGTDLNVVPAQLDISTGANIEPGPASQQDFSQPVNYTVTAGNGSPQVWTVNVDVAPNQPPIANDDTAVVELGETVRIDVTDNDTDTDNPNTDLVISGALGVQPINAGSFTIEGQEIVFTSSGDYTGDATFGYTINDGNTGNDDSAVVTVTIFETEVKLTDVSVTPTTATITAGEGTDLTATVLPANASNPSVSWSSSNPAVATVNGTGRVTGVSAGSATITVTSQDGTNLTATATITVEAATVGVTGVSVAPTTATVTAGESADLTATVLPANASNPSVSWSSSNPAVATVSGTGRVTGVSAGSAIITVTSQDGTNLTATATITVEAATVGVTGVSVAPTTATITAGEGTDLTATVLPANASNPSVSWSSSNPAVATVSGTGRVTGVSAGSAIITVTTQDGTNLTATATITVEAATVGVTGVSVAPTTATITAGEGTDLTATVLPANASNPSVSWSSSNPAVATVSGTGRVTGVSAGSAIITVTTQDGNFEAISVITVEAATIDVTGVSVTPTTTTVTVGSGTNLAATVSPAEASNPNVTWSSSNPAVATVNGTGRVTGVSVGSAIITVTTQDGNFTATSNITIRPVPVTITYNKDTGEYRAPAGSRVTVTLRSEGTGKGNATVSGGGGSADTSWNGRDDTIEFSKVDTYEFTMPPSGRVTFSSNHRQIFGSSNSRVTIGNNQGSTKGFTVPVNGGIP
ncbi:Ig-like domain (group 2) [Zobellia uliginosa]|uniref:Ig-like domain (Group 2) n=1 Tax=Zobellia uliginosa TaxID=143224 RepID=A0ABY1L178_9FLAO|nr:Ig-like domain-containing protein [Zobellia uliginosa]SIS87184.1 Ig-like domain (group 2) [Zobellia uliginosa]